MTAARSVGVVTWTAIALVALLTSAACSSRDGTVETAAVTSMSVERPTTTTAPVGTGGQPESGGAPMFRGDDPLGRRDVPAEGVPGLLPIRGSTDAARRCALTGAEPVVSPTSETSIGGFASICIAGFDASPAVSVEVAVPEGETRLFSVEATRTDVPLRFSVRLSDPTGTYRVTAVQGAKSATAAFSVGLPDRTLVAALDPGRGPRGTVFQFTVVTAAPNQTVVMDLYRGARGPLAFATTLDSVTTNSQARATYLVPTTTTSPAEDYCLVARPARDTVCAAFTVT